MVRGHDDLVRLPGMVEDDAVARTALGRPVAFVTDVACSDAKLTESAGNSPRQKFIEEQPDTGSRRRGATSYWVNTLWASI